MTRNLSTEAKVTPTGLQQEIGMGPALAARIKTVTNHAALEAIVPTSGAPTFYCTGHTTAGDGGEGVWRWVAGDSDTANGGTILGSDVAGRWKRAFSGNVAIGWFDSLSDALTYADNNRGVTLVVDGAYDATGLTIPDGCNLIGLGVELSSLSGTPTLSGSTTTPSRYIKNVSFPDGATLANMKKGCLFENCEFLDTVIFHATNWNYYNTFLNCAFRNVDGFVYAQGANNFNHFVGCIFHGAPGGGSNPWIELVNSGGTPEGWHFYFCSFESSDTTTGDFPAAMDLAGSCHKIVGCYFEVLDSKAWADQVLIIRGSYCEVSPALLHGHQTGSNPLVDFTNPLGMNRLGGRIYDTNNTKQVFGEHFERLISQTTDGSGDITIDGDMVDWTQDVQVTLEGTTFYTGQVHTRSADGSCKVRIFDAAGAAVTNQSGISLTVHRWI